MRLPGGKRCFRDPIKTPAPKGAPPIPGGKPLAVSREGNALDAVEMLRDKNAASLLHLPRTDHTVNIPGDQMLPIRRECNGNDSMLVSVQVVQFLLSLKVPKLDHRVIAA